MTRQQRVRFREITDLQKSVLESPVVIILDDLDFSWYPEEIDLFRHRWNSGQSLEILANLLRPDLAPEDARDEVRLLALHLYRQGNTDRVP
ncbi:MAG: hypothetical protein SCK57_10715 [Bacillota bacterium]|nr:hypothetical protein [Bacillota bacterium]MDW7678122.1 hypothetical protein [Bacillota bacterium]